MRYSRDPFSVLRGDVLGKHAVVANTEVGLYKLSHSLKAPGFNP
jgi:hypothetical protein